MIPAKVRCRFCGETKTLMLRESDIMRYKCGDGMVQDIFPYLSVADRELLISGMCGDCWDKTFG